MLLQGGQEMKMTKKEWVEFFNNLEDDATINIVCSTTTKKEDKKIKEITIFLSDI